MIKVNLFSQILSNISREKFDSLVKKHQSDKHNKGLRSWTHMVSMLFCHIGGACSVRDISNGLNSTTGNLSHLGVSRVPSKSSLSYMNTNRNYELFKDFYFQLLDHLVTKHSFAKKGLQQLKRKIYLIDGSIIPLCLDIFDWAAYRTSKGAVKLHAVLDYDGCLPVFAQITDGSVHEIKVAHTFTFPKGSVIVADRGYIDYRWLNILDSSGCFFITRAKTNMAFDIHQRFDVKGLKDDGVIEEQHVSFKSHTSKKQYSGKLRLIRFLDSITGKEYVFLTNNFNWKAKTVADIYKERWHIEVFFKQIKQHMKIKSFVGTSENAVQIQIWTAMTAILLMKFLKEKAKYDWHLSNLITFIRLNLFVKIDLQQWLDQPFWAENQKNESLQLNLFDG